MVVWYEHIRCIQQKFLASKIRRLHKKPSPAAQYQLLKLIQRVTPEEKKLILNIKASPVSAKKTEPGSNKD